MLQLAEIWNLGYLIVSLSIRIVRISKKALKLIFGNRSSNLRQDFFRILSNLGQREYIVI